VRDGPLVSKRVVCATVGTEHLSSLRRGIGAPDFESVNRDSRRQTRRRAVRRSHWRAGRERRQTARERAVRSVIELAWRFLLHQEDSASTQWYCARTESAGRKRKTMIVVATDH
jgi:hypothetical protein